MERIKKVLKESSHYVHHPNNMAKEYVLFDGGRFLELGDYICNIYGFKIIIKS